MKFYKVADSPQLIFVMLFTKLESDQRFTNRLFSLVCVSLQLYFVYWDMSYCWRTLCETLEERSFVTNENQVSRLQVPCCLIDFTEAPLFALIHIK